MKICEVPPMTLVPPLWNSLESCFRPFPSMDSQGQAWTAKDRHGQPCTAMDSQGQACTAKDRHVQPRTAMYSQGQAWTGSPWTVWVRYCQWRRMSIRFQEKAFRFHQKSFRFHKKSVTEGKRHPCAKSMGVSLAFCNWFLVKSEWFLLKSECLLLKSDGQHSPYPVSCHTGHGEPFSGVSLTGYWEPVW